MSYKEATQQHLQRQSVICGSHQLLLCLTFDLLGMFQEWFCGEKKDHPGMQFNLELLQLKPRVNANNRLSTTFAILH